MNRSFDLFVSNDANNEFADDAQFGHLPSPAGARRVFHWENDGEGHWSRQFGGTQHGIEVADPIPADRRIAS